MKLAEPLSSAVITRRVLPAVAIAAPFTGAVLTATRIGYGVPFGLPPELLMTDASQLLGLSAILLAIILWFTLLIALVVGAAASWAASHIYGFWTGILIVAIGLFSYWTRNIESLRGDSRWFLGSTATFAVLAIVYSIMSNQTRTIVTSLAANAMLQRITLGLVASFIFLGMVVNVSSDRVNTAVYLGAMLYSAAYPLWLYRPLRRLMHSAPAVRRFEFLSGSILYISFAAIVSGTCMTLWIVSPKLSGDQLVFAGVCGCIVSFILSQTVAKLRFISRNYLQLPATVLALALTVAFLTACLAAYYVGESSARDAMSTFRRSGHPLNTTEQYLGLRFNWYCVEGIGSDAASNSRSEASLLVAATAETFALWNSDTGTVLMPASSTILTAARNPNC